MFHNINASEEATTTNETTTDPRVAFDTSNAPAHAQGPEKEDSQRPVADSSVPVLDRRVSFLQSIYERKQKPKFGSLRRVLTAVQEGQWQENVEAVRREEDAQRRSDLKRDLPALAFAGAFREVNAHEDSLISTSGVVTLDLDKLDDLEATRDRVLRSQHTLACFVSPSGTGLKVMVEVKPAPISNAHYRHAYSAVAHRLGVEADPAASDISRLCFVSHDPDMYVNENATPLDLNDIALPSATLKKLSEHSVRSAEVSASQPGEITVFKDGQKHPTFMRFAAILRHEGCSEEMINSLLHHLNDRYAETPMDARELDGIAEHVGKFAPGERSLHRQDFLARIAAARPPQPGRELLSVKSAATWVEEARKRPMPRQIIGTLVHEREVVILYAPTNVGKSIFAVQIAEHVARGEGIGPFLMDTEPQLVLYLDCELSDQQLAMRARDGSGNAYVFNERFLRAEINQDADFEGSLDDAILRSLEAQIVSTEARFVIVDNLTYLKGQTQDAKDAIPFMQALVRLKKQYDLTLIVVAHTPKRDDTRPITMNDLAGSRQLLNLADAAFAIGRSTEGPDLRYLKQIKVRAAVEEYGEENVAVCRLEKREGFLQLQFERFDDEQNHVKARTFASNEEPLREEVLALHASGKSLREIGGALGVSHMKAKRLLDRARREELPAKNEAITDEAVRTWEGEA